MVTPGTAMLGEAKRSAQPTLGLSLLDRLKPDAGKPSWGRPRALHTACLCCGG